MLSARDGQPRGARVHARRRQLHRADEWCHRVWLPRDGLWVGATQLDEDEDEMTLQLDDEAIVTVPSALSLPRRNPEGEESAADLATLTHLDEPCILHALAERFAADEIYTWTGPILVSVK